MLCVKPLKKKKSRKKKERKRIWITHRAPWEGNSTPAVPGHCCQLRLHDCCMQLTAVSCSISSQAVVMFNFLGVETVPERLRGLVEITRLKVREEAAFGPQPAPPWPSWIDQAQYQAMETPVWLTGRWKGHKSDLGTQSTGWFLSLFSLGFPRGAGKGGFELQFQTETPRLLAVKN